MKIFRRLLAALLAVTVVTGTWLAFADEKAEVVKSYYLLKYEYQGFLEPLLLAGAKESQLVSFFGDVEKWINNHDDVSELTIDAYVQDSLLIVGTYRAHATVAGAVIDCYGEEIDEYTATGVVPQSLQTVYQAVIDAILRKDLPDKSQLANYYEEKASFVYANESSYEKAAVTAMKAALDEAYAVLKNKDADQAMIDDALVKLQAAYEEFSEHKKKPSSSGGGGGGGGGGAVAPAPVVTPAPTESSKPTTAPEATQKPEGDVASDKVLEFTDVPETYWGYDAITELSTQKIVNGFEDGTFRPEEAVTREQFAKMICEALKLEEKSSAKKYDDVKEGQWYVKYINTIYESGIMQGVASDTFGIGSKLIRQDMTVVAYRLYKEGFCGEMPKVEAKDVNVFADSANISAYALEAVEYAYSLGLINGMGDNSLMPGGTVTRAQAAQVIYNILQNK